MKKELNKKEETIISNEENIEVIEPILNAIDGFHYAYKFEQSLALHLLSNVIVISVGLLLEFSSTEWLFCILLLGLILAIELINTSLEAVVDLISPDIHPLAKIAKDTSSSATFIMTIITIITLLVLFIPKIIRLF